MAPTSPAPELSPDRPSRSGVVWTEDQVRALGVRTDGITACSVIYGDARTRAYQRLRAGEVDFPVLRRGRRYVVPVAALLGLLGLAASTSQQVG